MRYGNYFDILEGQGPPCFNNEKQNYSLRPLQSMTTVRDDFRTQDPKVIYASL